MLHKVISIFAPLPPAGQVHGAATPDGISLWIKCSMLHFLQP